MLILLFTSHHKKLQLALFPTPSLCLSQPLTYPTPPPPTSSIPNLFFVRNLFLTPFPYQLNSHLPYLTPNLSYPIPNLSLTQPLLYHKLLVILPPQPLTSAQPLPYMTSP